MSTTAQRPPLLARTGQRSKSFVTEFKSFALKGNVIDLAVAVVIGAAFGKIISAFVADVIMPFVALVLPSGEWRSAGIVLRHAADPKDDVVLKYGDLLGATLDFLLIALVLFVIVTKVLRAREKPAETTTKACPYCLESVPMGATRCRACTSDLVAAE